LEESRLKPGVQEVDDEAGSVRKLYRAGQAGAEVHFLGEPGMGGVYRDSFIDSGDLDGARRLIWMK
jgi:hypothetical protein